MSATEQMKITLRTEMAEMVRAKVASGEYASVSDVIADGLEALRQTQSDELESWLRNEVVPACEEYKADPSAALSPEQVRATLAQEYGKSSERS
jgi:antitoxin ParD1/3/4